jgi:hypothetical protein
MVLTDAEKTDVRRFMGYPAFGAGASGFQGWRFYQAYGLLEYRLNNLADAEGAVLRSYLTTLRMLEQAVPDAGANLDTAQVAVWTHNPNELRERLKLFEVWRRRLCGFLGLPTGPDMVNTGITLVV